MDYTIDTKKLESLITKLVEKKFADDKNYKIIKGVHHVNVVQRDEDFIDYTIFLELKDEIQESMDEYKTKSNFIKEYDGYGLYGMEVEKFLHINKHIDPSYRKVDVFKLFRDIKDFLSSMMGGIKFHPTLPAVFLFISR